MSGTLCQQAAQNRSGSTTAAPQPEPDLSSLCDSLRTTADGSGLDAMFESLARTLSAARRWHWEHPEERGKALALVRRALGENT